MLKPLAARMPETRESTPGSFCTRQFRMCRLGGRDEGRGVSYKIEDTAAGADQGADAVVGRGDMRLCKAL